MCDRSCALRRIFTVLALLVAGLLTVPKSFGIAQIQTAIVGLTSGANASSLFAQYGLTLLDSIPELNEYFVSGDAGNLQILGKNPNVASVEYDVAAKISETAMLNESTVALLDPDTVALLDGQGNLWNSQQPSKSTILMQPALEKINLNPASVQSGSPVIVAVIDTGVDPFHEMLIGATLSGQNFVNPGFSTNEMLDLDPSTAALLLQTTGRSGLNETVVALVNPATLAVLEPQVVAQLGKTPYFGHGTLVSGLIHTIAPTASILPLKAFDPTGIGTSFRIAKAIVYAAGQGARVINMSFNLDSYSALVEQAVKYASDRNIVLVASVGNTDSNLNQSYPASYSKVIGVASTDLNDQKASFSSYGPPAAIAAPGEALISSFPGSLYAAWSGTSASAALVSGEAALILSQATLTADQATNRIEGTADHLNSPQYQLGKGRIDLETLLPSGPSTSSNGNPTASSPAPNSMVCNGVYTGAFTVDVNVSIGQSCTFQNANIRGNVLVTGGTLTLSGGIVAGNVQINGGTFSIGPSTTISGNLQVQNIAAGSGTSLSTAVNQICGTLVYGNLLYQNSAVSVQIGSAAPSTCAGNVIGGSLQVQSNAGSSLIFANAVNGDLQDQSNTGSSQVFGNTVGGNLQCQSNSSITGGQNTAQQIQGQCATSLSPTTSGGGSPLLSAASCNGVFSGSFNGNVTVVTGQSCTFQNGEIVGNVQVSGGNLNLSRVLVRGNLQINGGTFSIGPSTTVSGNVEVQALPYGAQVSQICGSTVNGNLQVHNNGSAVTIGWSDQSICAGNSIKGNLEVHDNVAATSIFNNVVIGSLTDQNNGGPSQVFGNFVVQSLQCQGNVSITGGSNTAQQKQNQCAGF